MKPLNLRHSLNQALLLSSVLIISGCSVVPFSVQPEPAIKPLSQNHVAVCYGFSCNSVSQVELVGVSWNAIQDLFSHQATTPQTERAQISQAIALMEQLTGSVIGTNRDKFKNSASGSKQMDCIDESSNTTSYLKLFQSKGWLRWHRVQEKTYRSYYWLDIHWTAVIKDLQSQQLHAVDSWFRDNGQPPVIMTLEAWQAKQERL